MTQQFKFGDRVQDFEGKQFIFLRSYLSCCTVASEDGSIHDYLLDKIYPCATEPHPDTVRLDWLAKTNLMPVDEWIFEDEDGNEYEKAVVVRPDLNYFDEVLVTADDIRQAIDTAMRIQAEGAV